MDTGNIASLPPDVLHMLFQQIGEGGDEFRYSTLYNCIVASRLLASAGAVTALYRICNDAPVKGGGNEALSLAEQGQNVQRWAVLWRTIILSALGKTMFQYSKNLRLLDLKDFAELLRDDKFRGKTMKTFFSGDLAQFHFTLPAGKGKGGSRLDHGRILRAVGEAIIEQAPLLEGLWEPTVSDLLMKALPDWAPRLTHLRRLQVWDGAVFASETTRNLLHAHCPHLESLAIYANTSQDADHGIAAFIAGMPPNKLAYFENLGVCGIGQEACLALSAQGGRLKTMRLHLSEEGVASMGLLDGCTALRELSIGVEKPVPDMKATQNDVYLQVVEWLKTCTELKRLSFRNLVSAPEFALAVLQNKDVRLESLDINGSEDAFYVVKDHADFHRALAQQQSLQTLHLRADPDPTSRDDIETFINSVCSLTSLQDLKLVRISDYFSDEHIKLLVRYLPELRDLYIGGYGISDASLEDLANLKQLKNVSLNGVTTFTAEGIVRFINQLAEGNATRGMIFAVDNADPDNGISSEDQDMLRQLILDKLDGRFEYQLLRDPNAPDFDSDDSD